MNSCHGAAALHARAGALNARLLRATATTDDQQLMTEALADETRRVQVETRAVRRTVAATRELVQKGRSERAT